MTKIDIKILNTLLAIDIGIIIFCMISGNRHWLYTTQIGFFSSSLIIFASMKSYRNMIEKRVANQTVLDDADRDPLDEIDDPHELYSDEEATQKQEVTKEEFVEIVNEEKAKQRAKRRSPIEVVRDSKAFLSIYRLGAYGVLILGFFYLDRHHYLDIPAYLFSLSIPIATTVIILMRSR
ncbi:hypothetical protein MNB_SV-6-900 [hydrothermal vent metagenome]|uniref:Uncharacterized protein n=1 Tax=hydrothermal vent metagenome TaxID=652676 RepID=A0A1W1B8N8_9ZZZZ